MTRCDGQTTSYNSTPPLPFSIFAPIHVLLFNSIVFLLAIAHMKAVLSDPGTVPLPQNRLDFSNIHSNDRGGGGDDFEREDWTVCVRCETYR